MSQPLARPLTYDEFAKMRDDGKRYELIEGELVEMSTPLLRHQVLLRRLFKAFDAAVGDAGEVLFAPLDVILAPITALQPDLILVLPGNAGVLQDWIRGAPDLVVEILSPSTARLDRGRKLGLYARYGVGECWLVDDRRGSIEVHRRSPGSDAYHLAATFRPGERATTPLVPSLALDVAAFFAAS